MIARFTIRRKYFRLGLACLIFFLAMFVCGIIAMYVDARPDRRVAGILFVTAFFGVLISLSLYALVAYRKEAIIVGDDDVRFVGVLTDVIIRFTDVTRARWYMRGSD